MAVGIDPPREITKVATTPLCQDEFSEFGTVIENPAPALAPSQHVDKLPPNAVRANQGTALKYLDVTHLRDLYRVAPSKQPRKAVMNMFVCAPRPLLPGPGRDVEGLFPVEILERHPYTSQTFIPLGLSRAQQHEARYLVIVAPSLPPSPADEALPVPAPTNTRGHLPGRGLPDLSRLRAFMAMGSQAVTYGPGTWHAPMVVVGKRPVDFVVVQFANGVGIEDCQEAELSKQKGRGISVAVPTCDSGHNYGLWKL